VDPDLGCLLLEMVRRVVNFSEELAALSLMRRARLPSVHGRQAFVTMGWAEVTNMRTLLTFILNVETANSPQN